MAALIQNRQPLERLEQDPFGVLASYLPVKDVVRLAEVSKALKASVKTLQQKAITSWISGLAPFSQPPQSETLFNRVQKALNGRGEDGASYKTVLNGISPLLNRFQSAQQAAQLWERQAVQFNHGPLPPQGLPVLPEAPIRNLLAADPSLAELDKEVAHLEDFHLVTMFLRMHINGVPIYRHATFPDLPTLHAYRFFADIEPGALKEAAKVIRGWIATHPLDMSQVDVIELWNTGFVELPQEVNEAGNLRLLSIDRNPLLSELPSNLQLPHLRELHLENTAITKLPAGIPLRIRFQFRSEMIQNKMKESLVALDQKINRLAIYTLSKIDFLRNHFHLLTLSRL